MKIEQIFEDDTPKGTYAAVRFSQKTIDAIRKYCEANNIPNPVPTKKLHTTLLYSRKYCPNYTPIGDYEKQLVGTPIGFDVWKSQPTDKFPNPTSCLVLKYKCPELVARHKELMDTHGATFDYPEYNPHITLSYNVGDIDISSLPEFDAPIEITSEYGKELDLGWADKHANRSN